MSQKPTLTLEQVRHIREKQLAVRGQASSHDNDVLLLCDTIEEMNAQRISLSMEIKSLKRQIAEHEQQVRMAKEEGWADCMYEYSLCALTKKPHQP